MKIDPCMQLKNKEEFKICNLNYRYKMKYLINTMRFGWQYYMTCDVLLTCVYGKE